MINTFKILFITIFSSFILSVNAQDSLSIAGQYDSTTFHTIVNPEIIVFNYGDSDTLQIDLNNDEIGDFLIIVHYLQALGGSDKYAIIKPLNNNSVAYDTVEYGRKVAQIFDVGDTVNYENTYSSSSVYLVGAYSDMYSSYPSYNISNWHNIGDKYIGLRISENDISYYGWLKVNVENYKVKVFEYALNKTIINSISEFTIKSNFIYPNPAHDRLYIKYENETDAKIEIYNTSGKIMHINNNVDSNEINIPLEDFPNGLYIIRYSSGNNYLWSKFIKQ